MRLFLVLATLVATLGYTGPEAHREFVEERTPAVVAAPQQDASDDVATVAWELAASFEPAVHPFRGLVPENGPVIVDSGYEDDGRAWTIIEVEGVEIKRLERARRPASAKCAGHLID